MAEDFGDKTEAPTPRRREEAREQGNVARSPDLTSSALLLAGLVLLNWTGTGLLSALGTMVRDMLSGQSLAAVKTDTFGQQGVLPALIGIAKAIAPLFGGLVLVAVIANVAQV